MVKVTAATMDFQLVACLDMTMVGSTGTLMAYAKVAVTVVVAVVGLDNFLENDAVVLQAVCRVDNLVYFQVYEQDNEMVEQKDVLLAACLVEMTETIWAAGLAQKMESYQVALMEMRMDSLLGMILD